MDPNSFPPFCLQDYQRNLKLFGYVLGVTALTSICVIMVCLRVYTRLVVVKRLWWDDLAIVIATILTIADSTLTPVLIKYGLGQHVVCLMQNPTDISNVIKYQYIGQTIWIVSEVCSRISACLLVYHIFAVTRYRKWGLYILMATVAAINIVTAIIGLSQCKPVAKLWSPSIPGSCWSPSTQMFVGYFNGAISVISDLVVSLMPIYCLAQMQLDRQKKIVISSIMSLGICAAGCAIARTVLLKRTRTFDVTWTLVDVVMTAWLESCLVIVAATIPTLAPLFSMDYRDRYAPRRPVQEYKYIPRSPDADSGRRVLEDIPDNHSGPRVSNCEIMQDSSTPHKPSN